jgi:hypothetical protein
MPSDYVGGELRTRPISDTSCSHSPTRASHLTTGERKIKIRKRDLHQPSELLKRSTFGAVAIPVSDARGCASILALFT